MGTGGGASWFRSSKYFAKAIDIDGITTGPLYGDTMTGLRDELYEDLDVIKVEIYRNYSMHERKPTLVKIYEREWPRLT